jgi:hypothetical protein
VQVSIIKFHVLSRLAGSGHSRMLGLGFPILREEEGRKESYQGSGGPASWALVKQRWPVYVKSQVWVFGVS